MTRLLLHIGHPKTGTTALQSVLSANAEMLLRQASVLYPTRTKPTEFKHAFVIPWLLGIDNEAIRRRGRAKDEELRQLSKGYWESLLSEFNRIQPEQLILSAEGFWILRRAAEEKRTSFKQTLYGIADHITVAGYLKSPTSYFLSMVNQKLRNYRQVQLPRPNYYRASMRAWEEAGFDQCHWRIFDRRCLINQDIVDDFCTTYLPSSINSAELQRDGVEQANSSVSSEALVLLEEAARRYPVLSRNIYDHRRSKIVNILREADNAIGGLRRPSLKTEIEAGIVGRCKDLGWLQDRGLSFPDIDPALIRPGSGASHATQLPEQFTQVSDFFPVDTERLASLRAASWPKIRQLFSNPTMRFLGLFRAPRQG